MINLKSHLINLLSDIDLESASSEEIIEQIIKRIYEQEFTVLRSDNVFIQLPRLIQDIYLIIDFDTELQMNGIIGFIENSTGLYINETIDTLFRIGAIDDSNTLSGIRSILNENNITTKDINNDLQKLNQYQITNYKDIHRKLNDNILDYIDNEANKFYLYQSESSVFEYLIKYIGDNKQELIEQINKTM